MKEILEKLCIVMDMEKSRQGLVFTSMKALSKKINVENVDAKKTSAAVNMLQERGLIKIIKKNNRQTVIQVMDKEISNQSFEELESIIKDVKLVIDVTPERLLMFLKEKAVEENELKINSKEICEHFKCNFARVDAGLRFLRKHNKIDYEFKYGVYEVLFKFDNLISENVGSVSKNEASVNMSSIEEIDGIFDFIGKSLESNYSEITSLKEEVNLLKKKLELAEIRCKNLGKDLDYYVAQSESFKARNERLYAKLVAKSNQ